MTTELISQQQDQRELPDGWRWVKLGEIATDKLIGLVRSSLEQSSSAAYSYLKMDNILTDGRLNLDVIAKVDATEKEVERYRLRRGDFLFNTRNSFELVGKTALFPIDEDNWLFNNNIMRIRFDSSVIPEFIVWAFQSDAVKRQLEKFKNNTTSVCAIYDRQLVTVKIPLPPFSEQKRITAILNEQMEAVARARQATLAQIEAGEALPAAYLRTVFNSPEAQKWERKRLGDMCKIQLGKMLSPASKVGIRSRPYLRNANVQWNRFDLTDVYQMDFTEREEEKFELNPGDLLVCEGGEPGRSALWNGQITPCYYQKTLHRLRPINGAVDTHFLMYWFWNSSLQRELIESHTKTTIAHLTAIVLNEISIGIPPIIEQQRIAETLTEKLADVKHLQQSLKSQLDAINKLPATLLRRAFNGEL